MPDLITPSGRVLQTEKLRPLVDCDSFIYSAGFSADASVRKQLMETLGCDKEKATELAAEEDYLLHSLGNLKQLLQDSVRLFNRDDAKVFLTGSGNYREQIATLAPYKGNRDSTHKPRHYRELRNYAVEVWGAEVIDGMEADDAVSIEQFTNPYQTAIVSIDKDLKNTPGVNFNPSKNELSYVTIADADTSFWMQVATGDRTDNILGLHKVGPKTVQTEWNKHHDLEKFKDWIARMYDKQYRDEGPHAMHENSSLLWMQRQLWINYDGSSLR